MRGSLRRIISFGVCFALVLPILSGFPVRAEENDPPRIALTFDDGPHPGRTGRILSVLGKYSIKATFFILGCNAENYPEPLLKAVEEGHEIEDHSFDHQTRGKTVGELKQSILKTAEIIERVSGRAPRYFRPPEGKSTDALSQALSDLGYETVFWTVDSRDWTGKPADEIARDVLRSVSDGDILLFHDYTCPHDNTVHALEKIIPELLARGYRFVTVEELLSHENR